MNSLGWAQLTSAERQQRIAALVSLAVVCDTYGLTATEVHWLISTRGMPAWIVDGEWRFDRPQLEVWMNQEQGVAQVRALVRTAIEKHRQAQKEGAEGPPAA